MIVVGSGTYIGFQEFNGGVESVNPPGEGQVFGSVTPAGGINSVAVGSSADAEYNPFLPLTNGNIAVGSARVRHGGQNSIAIGTNAEAGQNTAVVKSTGSIQAVAGSNLLDTDNFILNDGTNPAVTFQYDSDNSITKTPTLRPIAYTSGDSQPTVSLATMNAIQEVIDSGGLFFSLVYGSPVFTINHLYGGSGGNIAIINNVADVGFIVTGMSGGSDFTDFANNAIAVGNSAKAQYLSSIAIGNSSSIQSNNAIAIGDSAEVKSNSTEGIAIGLRATVWNNCGNGIAIGEDAEVGSSSTGLSSDSIAIGRSATIGDNASGTVLIGPALTANDVYICAIGHNISVLSSNSVIIGDGCSIGTTAPGGVVFGVSSSIGNDAQEAIAIGSNAAVAAAADYGIAIGKQSSTTGSSGIAIGYGAVISSNSTNSISIGRGSSVAQNGCISIGYMASSPGVESVVIGYNAVGNAGSTVIGYEATAGGVNATIIGDNAETIGQTATAVGRNSTARERGVALGESASAWSDAVCIGVVSTTGTDAVAVGRNCNAVASCVAIGHDANASGLVSTALGNTATVTHDRSIAIGSYSVSTAADRCTIGTIGGSYDVELQIGLGFAAFGGTPPATQPSKISDPTDLASALTAVASIIDVLEGAGLSAA